MLDYPIPTPELTLFMKCVNVTEDDRRQKVHDRGKERECDLMDFKRMIKLPP